MLLRYVVIFVRKQLKKTADMQKRNYDIHIVDHKYSVGDLFFYSIQEQFCKEKVRCIVGRAICGSEKYQ